LGVGQIPWLFHGAEIGNFGAKYAAALVTHCTTVRGPGIAGGPSSFMELETEGTILHNELRKHPSLSHGESFLHSSIQYRLGILPDSIYSSLMAFWQLNLFVITCSLFANRTYNYYRPHNLMNVDARFRVQALSELFCMFRTRRGRLLSLSMR
jgi:hypothetical protein